MISLLACFFTVGCGQKGPLFLPKDKDPGDTYQGTSMAPIQPQPLTAFDSRSLPTDTGHPAGKAPE
jgi:predicted small lipoprotein YifL